MSRHHRPLLGKHDEMAAAMIAAAASRPARKRKSVNHYSDDNPSTFTIKRKRGQDGETASTTSLSPPTDKKKAVGKAVAARSQSLSPVPRDAMIQEELPDSRTGRRRRRPLWLAGSSHSIPASTTSLSSSRASPPPPPATLSSSTASTTSRRNKDPPSSSSTGAASAVVALKSAPTKKAAPSSTHAAAATSSTTTTTGAVASASQKQQQSQQQRPRVRFLPVQDKDDDELNVEKVDDVTLSHAVAIAPILKVSLPESSSDGQDASGLLLQQRYDYRCVYKTNQPTISSSTAASSSSYSSSYSSASSAPFASSAPLGRQTGLSMTVSGAAAAAAPVASEILGAPPAPVWKYCKLGCEQRLVKGPQDKMLALPPACLTCFAVRCDDPSYWLAGDAAGCLLLYSSLSSLSRPIQVVATLAHAREEQRTLISKTVIDYPNVIYKTAWRGNVVVAWTAEELQVLDVVQQPQPKTIFALPLVTAIQHYQQQAQPALQSLALHPRPNVSKLLWRPAHCRSRRDEERHVSLYLIDFSNPQNVTTRIIYPKDIVDTESFHCHAMVWEASSAGASSNSSGSSRHDKNGNDDKDDGNDGNDTSNIKNDIKNDDKNNIDDRVLMVAQYDDTLQLLRLNVSTCQVLQRVALPKPPGMTSNNTTGSNANNNEASAAPASSASSALPRHYFTDSVISLYDEYFFLCTGRGIRCYETSTLTFLSVYGESVALHGKTLGWQACFWIPEPVYDAQDLVVHAKKQQVWLERSDELATRHEAAISTASAAARRARHGKPADTTTTNGNNNSNNSNDHYDDNDGIPKLFSNMLLVGVPHPTRGPQELQSTLYVWKPGQVLPLQTVQAPMGGGLLGLHIYAPPKHGPTTTTTTTTSCLHPPVYHINNNGMIDSRILTLGWRMVCATQELGQAWEWQATMQSNFAGTMYPVGYQIIDDNIEYIEDEDELDQAVYKEQPEEEDEDEMVDDDDGMHVEVAEKTKKTKKKTGVKDDDDDDDDAPSSPSTDDPDLQEALRRSMMEATPRTLAAVSNTICVLNDDYDENDDDDNDDKIWIPSRPDPSLRRVFEKQPAQSSSPARHAGGDSSTVDDFAHHDFLRLFPQVKHVVKHSRHASAAAAASASSSFPLSLTATLPLKRQDSYSSTTSSLGRATPAPSPPTVPTMSSTTATTATATTSTLAVAAATTAIATTAANAPPPKMKGKRSRTANVEALLQASIDPLLRHKMGMINKSWANGEGSRLVLSTVSQASAKDETLVMKGDVSSGETHNEHDTANDAATTTENGNCIVAAVATNQIQHQFREDEEKELAMELLLLSPTSAAAKNNHHFSPPTCHVNGMLEQGRQNGMNGGWEPSKAAAAGPSGGAVTAGKSEPICPACHGRMVMHSCGKRDQPVDFEALARAEKERREEEEAEKQRLKVEKRRAAEAKRRETRRKKKEQEERKRQEEEEERLRQLEVERFAQENMQEEEEESEEEVEEAEPQVAVMDTSVHSTGANSQQLGDNETWTQSVFQPAFSPLAGSSSTGGGSGTRLAIPKFSEIAAAEHQAAVSSPVPAAAHAFTTSSTGTNMLMDPPQPVLTSEPLAQFYARQDSLLSDHSSNYSSSGPSAWPATTSTAATNSQYLTTDDTSNSNYASTGHPAWPATTLPAEDNNQNRYVSTGHPTWPATTTTTTTEFYMAGFSSNNDDLKPSRTISASDGDALAALAGLANIMPVAATETDYNMSSESNLGDWSNTMGAAGNVYDHSRNTTTADRRGSNGSYDYAHGGSTTDLRGSYDYAGSADRRSAIHAALTSQFASEESGHVFGNDGGTMQQSLSSFGGDTASFQSGQATHTFSSSSLSGSHAFLTDVNNTNHNNSGDTYQHNPSSLVSHLGNGTCDSNNNSNQSAGVQNSYLPYGGSMAAGVTFGSGNNGNEGHATATPTAPSFHSLPTTTTTTTAPGHGDVGAGIGSSFPFRSGNEQKIASTAGMPHPPTHPSNN